MATELTIVPCDPLRIDPARCVGNATLASACLQGGVEWLVIAVDIPYPTVEVKRAAPMLATITNMTANSTVLSNIPCHTYRWSGPASTSPPTTTFAGLPNEVANGTRRQEDQDDEGDTLPSRVAGLGLSPLTSVGTPGRTLPELFEMEDKMQAPATAAPFPAPGAAAPAAQTHQSHSPTSSSGIRMQSPPEWARQVLSKPGSAQLHLTPPPMWSAVLNDTFVTASDTFPSASMISFCYAVGVQCGSLFPADVVRILPLSHDDQVSEQLIQRVCEKFRVEVLWVSLAQLLNPDNEFVSQFAWNCITAHQQKRARSEASVSRINIVTVTDVSGFVLHYPAVVVYSEQPLFVPPHTATAVDHRPLVPESPSFSHSSLPSLSSFSSASSSSSSLAGLVQQHSLSSVPTSPLSTSHSSPQSSPQPSTLLPGKKVVLFFPARNVSKSVQFRRDETWNEILTRVLNGYKPKDGFQFAVKLIDSGLDCPLPDRIIDYVQEGCELKVSVTEEQALLW